MIAMVHIPTGIYCVTTGRFYSFVPSESLFDHLIKLQKPIFITAGILPVFVKLIRLSISDLYVIMEVKNINGIQHA